MSTTGQQLLYKVINAYGGLQQTGKFCTLKLQAIIGGAVSQIKGHPNALTDVEFTDSLTEQKAYWKNIYHPGYIASFTPAKVELFDENGNEVKELDNPRDSFNGHNVETPWSKA